MNEKHNEPKLKLNVKVRFFFDNKKPLCQPATATNSIILFISS